MILSSLLSFLVGMTLGQRFRVLIVLPAMVLTAAFTVCIGIEHAESTRLIALGGLASIVSVQIGYLAGTLLRHASAIARVPTHIWGRAP